MKPALRNVLLWFFFLLAPPALADDGFGVLAGVVFDAQVRALIEGVVVTARGRKFLQARRQAN